MMKIFCLTFLALIAFAGAEDFYIPVMRMEKWYVKESTGETNCVTKEYVSALVDQLYVNLTSALMTSKDGSGNDTDLKEDIQALKKMNADIIAILEHGFASHEPINTNSSSSTPTDCQDILNQGYNTTGIYTIYPNPDHEALTVRCDMDTAPGGWTVFQRRISDSDFYRKWTEYENGFGNLSTNFWLGNRYIHMLTDQSKYSLRVDLTYIEGETAYAEYEQFFVGDAESSYKLVVSGYNGTAGDGLAEYHNGMKFSTYDRDNDPDSVNCAAIFHGAWWYNRCHKSNLNGDYGNTEFAKGPVWEPWKGYYTPMKITEMKIRRDL